MKFPTAAIAASTLMLGFCFAAHAEVKPHALFSDDMVLQREKSAPVWGTAGPNEKVVVRIGKQYKSTQADAAGNWRVALDPMPAAPGLTLSIKGEDKGEAEIVFHNVAFGDVYICSGQSNMEMGVGLVNNAPQEIAAANYPNIRLLLVPHQVSGAPQKQFAAPVQWKVCTPQNIAAGGWGGFSAVGYFFGRELNQKLGVPIGLIQSAWGGTIAQAWTSRNTLLKRDDLRDATLETEKALTDTSGISLAERMQTWWNTSDAGTKNNWSIPAFDDAAWKTMKLPGAWEGNGLADFDGLVWFRKTIEIPAAWEGKDLTLHLGAIDDRDTTFWNGAMVGSMDQWNVPRVYKIAANLVKAGRVTISVRVLDTGGGGGLYGGDEMRLELAKPEANDATQKLDVSGDWKYQVSAALKDLPPAPIDTNNGNPNQPTVLFNGMIAPLVPFSVRGAIWYQGESNAGNPGQYQTLFPDLIKDWRTVWNAKQDGSEFGFYFVQLANFTPRVAEPVQSGWAELRDAQTQTLKLVPRTGMATILDIGDAGDIHPRNKQDVGKRLALAALATEYKQKIEYSGPTFHLMEMEDGSNRVKIHFTHALGLTIKNPVPVVPINNTQEYPDVPAGHWAYAAIDKLSQAGIIEEYPGGQRNRLMTRYEFAVAIARLQQNLGTSQAALVGPQPAMPATANKSYADLKNTIFALSHEFAPEIAALGVRVGDLELVPRPLRPEIEGLGAFVKGFSIRGEDGQWYWAEAHLDGESVVVWSGDVPRPVAVRYAWANNPDVNLVNAAGLPAIPFSTDGAK